MSQPNHFYTHTFCQHKANKTRGGLPIVNCRTQARYSDLFCRKSSLLALYRTLSIVGERFNNLSNYLRSCCIISHHLPQYAIFPLVYFHIVGASQYTVQKSWVWCVCVPPNQLNMKKISLQRDNNFFLLLKKKKKKKKKSKKSAVSMDIGSLKSYGCIFWR